MNKMIWLGLDVHADSIAIAKYVGSEAKGEIWEMPNDPKKIRRKMTELRKEGEIRCAYEAGPCGYELYRQLTEMGIVLNREDRQTLNTELFDEVTGLGLGRLASRPRPLHTGAELDDLFDLGPGHLGLGRPGRRGTRCAGDSQCHYSGD
mgnify:CR=1 FL=1